MDQEITIDEAIRRAIKAFNEGRFQESQTLFFQFLNQNQIMLKQIMVWLKF